MRNSDKLMPDGFPKMLVKEKSPKYLYSARDDITFVTRTWLKNPTTRPSSPIQTVQISAHFHSFGSLENRLHGNVFQNNEEIKERANGWLRE